MNLLIIGANFVQDYLGAYRDPRTCLGNKGNDQLMFRAFINLTVVE